MDRRLGGGGEVKVPGRGRNEGPGKHLWSPRGHASDPSAFSGFGSECAAAWEWRCSKTVRPLRLEVWPSWTPPSPGSSTCHTDPGQWTGHAVRGVRLFLFIRCKSKQANYTPDSGPDELRENKSPHLLPLPRTGKDASSLSLWLQVAGRSSPALRHHISHSAAMICAEELRSRWA